MKLTVCTVVCPYSRTPRIVRRISFGDEADMLIDASLGKHSAQGSNGKHERKKTLGIVDDDDEDAEWRESLAYQPRHFE